ncbi:unnamed protein product [Chironomus riparius]|uniref:Uncharacterized protein n=1 Tax=Chironomus riparius TaxID=315576 RepID=A0A9N9WX78_9DIPT|nr:unnamed protein product [Chironomus riparius]
MKNFVKILIFILLVNESLQEILFIGDWDCLFHGTEMFYNAISTSLLSRNPENGAYSIRIDESETKSSIVYGTLNQLTIHDIEALVDLVIITYDRNDVKIKTLTFPLKGPQHEIHFETPFEPSEDYNITLRIYQCHMIGGDAESDGEVRDMLETIIEKLE